MRDAPPAPTVLRVDGSMRHDRSVTRKLTDQVIDLLAPVAVITRDLTGGVPFVTQDWIGANFTPKDRRTDAQAETLGHSDTLVEELRAADVIVIGTPIYNFHVPAALKAWIDMVARAGETFHYTENGPKGLLRGKKAYVVIASGGVALGSGADFISDYLKFVLGFIGITDVTIIDGSGMSGDPEARLSEVEAAIPSLVG